MCRHSGSRRSVPVFVAHPADEGARTFLLHRPAVGQPAQCIPIDRLPRFGGRRDLRDRLAAASDLHRLTRFDLVDQFGQTRLGVGEAIAFDDRLLTSSVTIVER